MTEDPTPEDVERTAAEIRAENLAAMLDDPPRAFRGAGTRREPRAVKCGCAVPWNGSGDD